MTLRLLAATGGLAFVLLVSACGSSRTEVTSYADFTTHWVDLNNKLHTELSDGSPSLQFDWQRMAADEINWLDEHPASACYDDLYSLWRNAIVELASGGNPGTGDATGRYVLGVERAIERADGACPV